MFDKAKQLYNLQRQASQVKKELRNIHIEAESDGVMVVIDAKQVMVSVNFPDEYLANPAKLKDNLLKAFNKAIKKSQQIAAEKMKGVMGELGLPGGV